MQTLLLKIEHIYSYDSKKTPQSKPLFSKGAFPTFYLQ